MKTRILGVCCDGLEKGGIQNVIMSIVRNLGEDFAMDLIVFSEGDQYYTKEFSKYGKIYHFRPKKKKGIFKRNYDELTRCYYYEHEFRKFLNNHPEYNVIHCHNYFEAAPFLKVAKEFNIPVRIAHSHNVAPPQNRKNPLAIHHQRCMAKMIHQYATHRIACSKGAGEYLFGSDPCVVINNAIDVERFDPNKYHSPEFTTTRFAHVGRYCYQKNQLFLVDVFNEYRKLDASATLMLVGFGEDQQAIENKINSYGLQDQVRLLPSNSDVADVFAKSNAMIFPSTYEGLGISLIEAQAMGVRCYVSEAIQPEADLGLCKKINLSVGASEWARIIFEDIECNGTKKSYVSMQNYNIKYVIQCYEDIYRG